jgi:hypothetical protein
VAFVYSQQFGLWKDKDNGGPIAPPDGNELVLRQVTVYNGNTLSAPLEVVVFESISTTYLVSFFWDVDEVASRYWTGRIVIAPGQALGWQSTTGLGTAEVDVYLGGYTLSLP